jgi:hypothetical protein
MIRLRSNGESLYKKKEEKTCHPRAGRAHLSVCFDFDLIEISEDIRDYFNDEITQEVLIKKIYEKTKSLIKFCEKGRIRKALVDAEFIILDRLLRDINV